MRRLVTKRQRPGHDYEVRLQPRTLGLPPPGGLQPAPSSRSPDRSFTPPAGGHEQPPEAGRSLLCGKPLFSRAPCCLEGPRRPGRNRSTPRSEPPKRSEPSAVCGPRRPGQPCPRRSSPSAPYSPAPPAQLGSAGRCLPPPRPRGWRRSPERGRRTGAGSAAPPP
ncbi:acidic proline-rich protein PRP25-like [Dryobates pubescens]|uniref:acidic proline-rich protein PRP25-like n=1 Tax=Dryobates pubescens TaxID=118200 RepID=UPI0023B8D015|nr:acidic proline-rich protein PRP25-like [Dryobates pubescens]